MSPNWYKVDEDQESSNSNPDTNKVNFVSSKVVPEDVC